MRKIEVGDKKIGDGEPCFIVAEVGINHNGDIELAKELVKKTAETGADAVKFQIFKTEEFCSKNSDYFKSFKSLELSEKDWIELMKVARDKEIIFTASVFGEESADLLDDLEAPVFKIASGDLTYHLLLRYIAKKKKPIILSTGMATMGEIEEALNEIYSVSNTGIAILHCVSNYPTNYEETNLRVIQTLKEVFKVPVGFSDHSVGTIIPTIAVSLGANLIEKHFTLDKTLPGPDHKLSLDPNEFREMVKNIRITEKALGDGIKRPIESEKVISSVRRSIVAREIIPKGTKITKEMLKIVRPGTGIEPKYLGFIKDKISTRDIKEEDPITWEDIE